MSALGLRNVRLMVAMGHPQGAGQSHPNPIIGANQREELSSAISEHKHSGAVSGCVLVGQAKGKTILGWEEEPTCAVLIKEAHLLSHQ